MTPGSNIATLDGLRGLAVITVILAHAWYAGWLWMPYSNIAGSVGVMMFFSLSGFLIAHLYLPGTLSARYWAAFIVRRTFRIYPNFIAVLLTLWGLHAAGMHITDFDDMGWTVVKRHLLLADSRSVFWTLPPEIKFYSFVPCAALIILLCRLERKAALCTWIAIWCAAVAADAMQASYTTSMRYLWYQLPFFAGGIIVAYIRPHLRINTPVRQHLWNIASALCIGLWYALIFKYHIITLDNMPSKGHKVIGIVAALASLTVLLLSCASGLVYWLFANPVLRFMGTTSYSVYLTHAIVLRDFRPYIIQYLHTDSFWAAMAIIMIMGCLFHYIIEKPGIEMGKRLSSRIKRLPGRADGNRHS